MTEAATFDPHSGVISMPRRDTNGGMVIPHLNAAWLMGCPVKVREWIVEDLIPAGTVTMLNGDGGTGKSLLALQLVVAMATSGFWIGREVRIGPCLYLSAEDDLDELHRRLIDIARANEIALGDLDALSIVPLAGQDALLATVAGKNGVMAPTKLFKALEAMIAEDPPALLVLDTLADIFGGQENERAQARQFIGLLRGLCVRHGVTVLLLAHPSLSGMSSGSGSSGSTAWNNSVRSRLYFERMKDGDGSEPDPDIRVLRTMKANYAATGQEIRLRWQAGVFKPVQGVDSFAAMASQSKAERVFLDLLKAYESEGRPVSASTGHGYAPAIFAKDARAEGIAKSSFVIAMNHLFEASRIRNIEVGPPSRRTRRLETVPETGAQEGEG